MGYLIELDPLPSVLVTWPQPPSAPARPAIAAALPPPEFNDDLEDPGPAQARPAPPPLIEHETPLVPAAAAAAVLEEAAGWLGESLPQTWRGVLIRRANAIYARNPQFRRKIHGHGPQGRDCLWTFMRHWLAALLLRHRPDLYARLPSGYQVGRPLPR